MTKKRFTLIALVATLIIAIASLMPSYQCLYEKDGITYGYFSWPWDAFLNQQSGLIIPCFIFMGLYMALLLVVEIFYLISFKAKEEQDDREDKFFVFGCFIGAIGSAFYALMCIGISSFIPMVLALLFAILYVVGILIHHKYLIEI